MNSRPVILGSLALFLLILVPTVFAADASFNISFEPVKQLIAPSEAAYYRLVVTNQQAVPDTFIISTDEFDWVLDTTELLSDVPGGATRLTFVVLSPKADVTQGIKLVRVKVRSANTHDFQDEVAQVTVRNANGSSLQYAPSIFLSAKTSEQVDPREPLTVSVYLRNRNARDYPNLTVRVHSDIFDRQYTTTLGGIAGDDGEKTNQMQVQLDPATQPGTHPLTITILANDTTINTYETTYKIIGFGDETRAVTSEGKYFRTTTRYTVTNNGNVAATVTVEHPTSFFRRLFTNSDAASTLSSDHTKLVFTNSLAPHTSVTVEVTENYRLLVILIVIVIISIVLYFVLRSPVIMRKEAVIKGGDADGVSEMRIRLHVKSRGAKTVRNIHVVDRITSMADIAKETSLGTLQPTKVVKKPGHGTLVRWDLDALEPFEERIISYTVKTKLKLIGDVYLPAAKVKFDQHGRERTAYSNEVNIPREN